MDERQYTFNRHKCGNTPVLDIHDEYDVYHGSAYCGSTYQVRCACGMQTRVSRKREEVINIWESLGGILHED